MTRTVATLEISAIAFQEISDKLRAGGCDHLFMADGTIDMYGIGVARGAAPVPSAAAQAPSVYMHKFEVEQMQRGARSSSLAVATPGGAYSMPLYAAPVAPAAAAPRNETLPFESALFELINKIDSNLDTGDMLEDAKRASAALDAILSKGDLVANAHDYFRDSQDRYEKSIEFRIGWNACLDALVNARAVAPTPTVAADAAAPSESWKEAEAARQFAHLEAQPDERAALDDVKPLVDEWIRSRGTSMDGESYLAALQLAAHVKARTGGLNDL
ncbi:hypothetical protein LMG28688_01565 [Paraburkholderia caffeinitolerans]|uniref:Uncharacterized protein n=1 Tax=Paraburkholderia caffeinitolerans TaxID=1723730 RepID=A0A6J5FQ20_9BURK|nr:hypothetical protein [Paraburkholderia caffeinitolerans]CAB3783035.1 hypothetical protein LMG28688_01565 [Paraburkholderia caffeinitolerans]